ncbi:MAG: SusC/RagA family TonB-linked outer membrane protein [Bacteroidia bacterium]
MLLILAGLQAQAQRTVSGRVTDSENGQGLAGVTVVVKGTTAGALTNDEGNYSVRVGGDADVLVFSFIGYERQEIAVGNQTAVNVQLLATGVELDDVVITALGIARDKKALGYAVTEVAGSEFTEAREVNIANALSGKIAGVNISNLATGPAGSARITIRGNVSINGNNQPLFVVDGIPIDNSNLGSAGMWGGTDGGDGISSLNPDDIETITVLKGNSAAALYGSRASNGVILITTKKGSNRKGVGVEVNSNLVFETLNNQLDFQTEYGHGNQGLKPTTQAEAQQFGLIAWGPKLDGSNVIQFDGQSRPYSNVGDNLSRFYQPGLTFTNTLSLSSGSENSNFRLGATRLDNQGIVPNSGLTRHNFSLNGSSRFGEKLSSTITALYTHEDVRNRPRLSDSPGNGNYTVGLLPPSIDVESLYGNEDYPGTNADRSELQFNDNPFVTNPWFAAYQYDQYDIKDRIIGSVQLRYDITSWLYVMGRAGMDYYQRRNHSLEPYGLAFKPQGGMSESENRFRETNLDLIVGVDKTFGDFGVNVFVGGNQMRQMRENISISGNQFNIPYYYSFSNLAQQSPGTGFSQLGINSVYGSAEFSYAGMLYLTATARQDWFSTLTAPSLVGSGKSYSSLYPSISASFLLNEAVSMPKFVTYSKLRASWAQVGGATDPYALELPYGLVGRGHLGQPLGGVATGTIPNTSLVALTSTSWEVGLEARLFNNRMGIDVAYYNQQTTDDIIGVTISQTSGFSAVLVNVGRMSNRGIETLLTGRLVQSGGFSWDVNFNFAYNWNRIDSLAEGLSSIQADQSRTQNGFIQNRTGEPYSAIVGYTYKRTEDGTLILDGSGLPQRSDAVSVLGYGNNPLTGGLTNSFSYKGINLSFLIDFQAGGDIYAATNAYGYFRGLHKNTLEGRDGLSVTGVDATGAAVTRTVSAQDYYQRVAFNITEEFVAPADFVKLRQINLGYSLPASILEKTPFYGVSISLVGRNLAILYKAVENIDPESTYNNSNAQGLEMFGVPSTRSLGFNLNLKF